MLSDAHYRRIFTDIESPVKQALETIFVSRPILFLGYSLRDPDLTFILRTLRARYRGNAGELWAIIPDVTEMQRQELWVDFRIRTVSYSTTQASVPAHADLLRILRALKAEVIRTKSLDQATGSATENEAALAVGLARYAARLVAPVAPQLPVYARLPWDSSAVIEKPFLHFLDGREVGTILKESKVDTIIVGTAGSGKSWSVTRFMSECAQLILKDVSEGTNSRPVPRPLLPIRLDCQAYEGDFNRLLTSTVPASLDLTIASKTYTIVLLLDSIDEMPLTFVEDQSWNRGLAKLKSKWLDVRTIYLSRRRHLVPDPTLPTFEIQPLRDDVLKQALAEISIDMDDLASDVLEQLRTPYILQMLGKLLPHNRKLNSTLKITEAYVAVCIHKLPAHYHRLENALAFVASSTLLQGRETFALDDFAKRLRLFGVTRGSHRNVVDKLIEVGILRSETERRLRFSHRIITEYFASRWIAQHWKDGDFSLLNCANLAHLHNTLIWSADFMSPDNREQFFDALTDMDFSVACAIADAAEVQRGSMWIRVLKKMSENPPHSELAYDLSHVLEHVQIPDEALPQLKQLTGLKESDLSGWALSKLIPTMSCDEVKALINQIAAGDIDWNDWNWAGRPLGERLDEGLLKQFKQAMRDSKFATNEEEHNPEDKLAVNRAYAFETVVAGLRPDLLAELLSWARTQKHAIRRLVVRGISEFDTKRTEQFMLRQWDLGVPQTDFSLFLRLRYGQPKWKSPTPRFTSARLNRLIRVILTAPKSDARWSLSLLRTLAELDRRWSAVVARRARDERNKTLRPILAALVPGQRARVLRRRVQQLLSRGSPPSDIDRALFEVFDDTDLHVLFSEDDVLIAFATYGASVWTIFDLFLNGSNTSRKGSFIVRRVDKWIDCLYAIKVANSDPFSVEKMASFVAKNLSKVARERVLERANDSTDLLSTFILIQLVRRMDTVTTDDLTGDAGRRLVSAFFSAEYDGDPFPTLGAIATERFIRETLLPYARCHPAAEMLEDIERTLIDAGRRHGIRYRL